MSDSRAEIARLEEWVGELYWKLMRMTDRWQEQRARIESIRQETEAEIAAWLRKHGYTQIAKKIEDGEHLK